jgi:hypothetical protein
VGAVALVALVGGLAACDSTAKFSIVDRKFNDVQVVSAFPAFIDGNGGVTRVCGKPMDGDPALDPNGLELVVNFVSTDLKRSLCDHDRDLSIKAGELIELVRVRTTGNSPTVGPKNFKAQFDCVSPYGPGGATGCSSPISDVSLIGAGVRYHEVAKRCDPAREDTRQNVALLVDHSGSVSGFVDRYTYKEDKPLMVLQPNELGPYQSDPLHARIAAAHKFLDNLNDRDRAIGYSFGEKEIRVAASDARSCFAGAVGKKCVLDKDCGKNGICAGDPSQPNSFADKDLGTAEGDAFGANEATRAYLRTALDEDAKYNAEGRAPLWAGLETAYDMLVNSPASKRNRHVLVITDGPDTCTHGEDFAYTGPDKDCVDECIQKEKTKSGGICDTSCENACYSKCKTCRTPCDAFIAQYDQLLIKMHQDKFPVAVHVIQFQAKGYSVPDPRLMEVACRTQGTYQFVNSQEMALAEGSGYYNALTRAAARARLALGGTWRVGFTLNSITSPTDMPRGKIYSVRGHLQFINPKFASLDQVYADSTAWRFDFDAGNEDRRLLFRMPCADHAACGGGEGCGTNHCDGGGLCRSTQAPDKLPCPNGICCAGTCLTGGAACEQACK